MAYEIRVQCRFRASHQLRLPDGMEPLHEHDWRVRLTVGSARLDEIETVMDFHELERLLRQIVNPWQGQRLNDCPPFRDGPNPSAERVAETIARSLHLPPGIGLLSVEVEESPGCLAIYRTG